MIRKALFIFCENEHGTGDVCFPPLDGSEEAVKQQIVEADGGTVKMVRDRAKAAGWGRVNGGDYCPACMDTMGGDNL